MRKPNSKPTANFLKLLSYFPNTGAVHIGPHHQQQSAAGFKKMYTSRGVS